MTISIGDQVSLTTEGTDLMPGKVMYIDITTNEAEVRFPHLEDPHNANLHMVGVYPIEDLRLYP